MPRPLSPLVPQRLAGPLAALALLLPCSLARAAVLLPVPYTAQDNITFSCGSCGSASSGMALAYLGGKNPADEIEHWLYAGLPCAPGESAIVSRDNAYCSSHGLPSPCATHYDWSGSQAWANLKAQIDSGRPFVAHVHQYGYYHYVLVSGYADGQVYLSDSAQSKKGWRSWSLFSSQWGEMGYDGIRFLLPGKPAVDPVGDELLYQAGVFHPSRSTDIDGDGRMDVCVRGVGGVRCWLSRSGQSVEAGGPPWSDAGRWNDASNYSTIRLGDIDGDGLADLCGREDTGIVCWLSDGKGFPTRVSGPPLSDQSGWNKPEYFTTLELADMNGDGKDDLCARTSKGFQCWRATGSGFASASVGMSEMSDAGQWNQRQFYGTIRMGDVDGDGKQDVCGRGAGGMRCFLSDGSGFPTEIAGPAWSEAKGWGGDADQYWSTIRLADVNGDGRADLCARGTGGYRCALSSVSGFEPELLPASMPFSDAAGWTQRPYFSTIRLADVDGDGRAELCGRGKSGLDCYAFTPTGFSTTPRLSLAELSDDGGWNKPERYRTISLADVDGDGRADLCARWSDGLSCCPSSGSSLGGRIKLASLPDAEGWNQVQYYSTLRASGVRRRSTSPAAGDAGVRSDGGRLSADAGVPHADWGAAPAPEPEAAPELSEGGCSVGAGTNRCSSGWVLAILFGLALARRARRRGRHVLVGYVLALSSLSGCAGSGGLPLLSDLAGDRPAVLVDGKTPAAETSVLPADGSSQRETSVLPADAATDSGGPRDALRRESATIDARPSPDGADHTMGWDYDLTKRCAKTVNQVGSTNYYEDTTECQGSHNWTLGVTATCGTGPSPQSFLINQVGSPVTLSWKKHQSSIGPNWSVNLKVDTVNTSPISCPDNYVFFSFMDNAWEGGGPLPKAMELTSSHRVSFKSFVPTSSTGKTNSARVVYGAVFDWDGKGHHLEINPYSQGWGDGHPDPGAITVDQSFKLGTGSTIEYVVLDGPYWKIELLPAVETFQFIDWKSILQQVIAKKWFTAPQSTTVPTARSVYVAVEVRNAAVADLWHTDFRIAR